MTGRDVTQKDTPTTRRHDRQKLALELARRYYLEDISTPDLARELGVSRSTVSRLISSAKDQGWVRIEVSGPDNLASAASTTLAETYNLEDITEVTAQPDTSGLTTVAHHTLPVLTKLLKDETTVGIAWGTTTAAIANKLTPAPLRRCRLIQLNGAGSLRDLELDYAFDILSKFATAWKARAVIFPVPAFFDYAETREALWKERTIARVRSIQASCDMSIFSVGSTTSDVPSRVHLGGYLNNDDRNQLANDGAVGDIATNFFRSDGTSKGIEVNTRASGISLEDLRNIPIRVCVAHGVGKADALLGALRGGYITHLIADQTLLNKVHEKASTD